MKTIRIGRQVTWGIIAIACAVSLLSFSPAFGGIAQTQPPDPPKASATRPNSAIPLAEVAVRAAEASSYFRDLEIKLAPSAEITSLQKLLPESNIRVYQGGVSTFKVLQGQPPFALLQAQQEFWQEMQRQTTGWMNLLTERSTKLNEALEHLADQKKTWSETSSIAKASNAPAPILEQVSELLGSLESARKSLQSQLSFVLELQSQLAPNMVRSQTFLEMVVKAQRRAVVGILTSDSRPIWSSELWIQARGTLADDLHATVDSCFEDIRRYSHGSTSNMPLHLVLFIVLVVFFSVARRYMRREQENAEEKPPDTTVFDRPISAALIGTLFIATGATSVTPYIVRQLFEILMFVPMIRLAQPVIYPWLKSWIYSLGILFFLDTMRQSLAGAPLVGQAILMLETLAGIMLLSWSLLLGRLRLSPEESGLPTRMHIFAIGAFLIILDLASGFVTGVFGYLRLADLLTSGVVVGATFAFTLYIYYRLVNDVVRFLLRSWPLRLLKMVQNHRDLVELRVRYLLVCMAIFGWVVRFLDYIGLFDPVVSAGQAILATKFERGSISISLDDVIAFILTVWAAYLLSAFIRFILSEDIYPRVGIGQGLSYAISSLLNYVILALGVVVGMGLMGVDLSKVSVLAGAFGVGIGFGLQAVVNNFVCGLILLFERPVHVGDLIEIGGQLAEVRRIGIRASTVHTRRGSDLVVPNSQLVTEEVTNWTLGDKYRRIGLPVGVNYGADPREVITLLQNVARLHPKVLAYPQARALFISYGDSSLNFELRAWTAEFLQWRYVQSELAIAVYDAVIEAGMSFPFPQRDVHLLRGADTSPPEPKSSEISPKPMEETATPQAANDLESRK